ncbi:type III-B CRISPR module RAMP protein Cmr1 [Microcoleus sp. F8-D3]
MEVTINTLTPLWTGGIDTGKCDRIHETGLLGSLRWWMEVLVRGMGEKVDEPTSESRNGLDPKKFDIKAYRQLQDEVERRQYLRAAGLCDVSQIFGATGWKRRFRLEIQDIQVSDATIQRSIKANRIYTDNKTKQKTPTWYFPTSPKSGFFTIQIQSLHPDFKPEVIGGLIQFIADRSALGARPQMGFGVIKVEGDRIDMQPLYDWLIATAGSNTYPADMPSLQNIFLAQIQPKDSSSLFKEEDTFNVKYDIRQLFRTEKDVTQNKSEQKGLVLKKDKHTNGSDGDKDLRHFIMGTVDNDPTAAKVKISRPYKNDNENDKLIRVWGWIPAQAEVYKNDWNREKIVDVIYQHLTAKYTLHDWREMNSARDTKTPNISDAKVFLRNLLQLQGDG